MNELPLLRKYSHVLPTMALLLFPWFNSSHAADRHNVKPTHSFTFLLKASVKIFNVPKGPSAKGVLDKLWYYWEMMEPHQEVGLIGGN